MRLPAGDDMRRPHLSSVTIDFALYTCEKDCFLYVLSATSANCNVNVREVSNSAIDNSP
jgi:hypothetical protein